MDNLHNNVAHEAGLETIWPAGILFVDSDFKCCIAIL